MLLLLLNLLSPGFAEVVEPTESTLEVPSEDVKVTEQKEAELLAAPSDANSIKLLNNNLTVIGAKSGITQITAYGTFTYGKDPTLSGALRPNHRRTGGPRPPRSPPQGLRCPLCRHANRSRSESLPGRV